jgi:hypothetical protein
VTDFDLSDAPRVRTERFDVVLSCLAGILVAAIFVVASL